MHVSSHSSTRKSTTTVSDSANDFSGNEAPGQLNVLHCSVAELLLSVERRSRGSRLPPCGESGAGAQDSQQAFSIEEVADAAIADEGKKDDLRAN